MTVEKLKSGSFRARVFLGIVEGKKKYKNFTGSNKKQLIKDASAFEYSLKLNNLKDYDITLGQAIDTYIEGRSNILSPSTIAGYKKMRKNNYPDIIDLKLNQLSSNAIQTSINTLSKDVSPKTVSNVFGLLSATLKKFHKDLILDISLPMKQSKAKKIPNSDIINTLLSGAKNTDLEIAIILATFSLRRSEIVAMTSSDVYDTFIRVDKAIVTDEHNNEVLKGTKNGMYRDIPVPPSVIKILKRKDGSLVDMGLKTLDNKYSWLRKTLNIDGYGLHTLRHYYASVLHSLGVPDKYVAERGGWSDVKTLQRIYQHSMEENQKEIDSKTNDFFSNKFNF